MAETFNPYAEWLGVRSAAAQPNHYELLRLELLESDPDAILTAANMQMAKVRALRPGEHVDDWRRLLDELAAAKRCLSDEEEKSRYDAALRDNGPADATTDSSSASAAGSPNFRPRSTGSTSIGAETPSRGTPYMEVTEHAIANPLPPGFGKAKPVAPGVDSATTSSPRSAREPMAKSQAAAAENTWIPAAASDMPWMPPSRHSATVPQSAPQPAPRPSVALQMPSMPATSIAPSAAEAPTPTPAQKPKLASPGGTVHVAAEPASPPNSPLNSPPHSSDAGIPLPAPTFPAGLPQSGGVTIQLPRSFPLLPMPGMSPHGALAPNALPFPQQPFAGSNYPGAPGLGMKLPLQPAGPGASGIPISFPQPANVPNPHLPGSMPAPGGMPGFFPATAPQATTAPTPQPAMQQAADPVVGTSFLDDVLSGPKRGPSPLDDSGFDDPSPPSQSAAESHSAAGSVEPGGFGEASPSAGPTFDQSASDATDPHRSASRSRQRSRTMLVAGALSGVVLLAGVLVAALILKQRDGRPGAIDQASGETAANGGTTANGEPVALHSQDHSPTESSAVPSELGSHGKPSAAPASAGPSGNAPTNTPSHGNTLSAKSPNATEPNRNPAAPADTALVLQSTALNPSATTPAKPATAVVDPVKAARFNRLLVDARHQLAERKQEDANRSIAEAKSLAVTPEQIDRVGRLGTLVKYVGEFWGSVRDALGAVKIADEIDVGTTKVVVVESDQQSLTIHMGSGNHHFTLKDLPSGLAIALANRWLDPNKPANKVFVGSFCAVDPKLPDGPGDARQLWSEAAAAGVVDGQYLLPLLNSPPAEAEMATEEALPPVPDAEAVGQATLKIKAEFDDAIAAATTRNRTDELIQRFFDAADSSDNPVRRYALCIQARDTAAKTGRAKLAIDAIDRIARDFRVDALNMKVDALSNNPPTTEQAGREVARAALALVDEAVGAKRTALASRLAQVAFAAAQVSKGNDLIRRATQRRKEIDALAGKKAASEAR